MHTWTVMMSWPDDSAMLSARQLAFAAGISATTVKNWAGRPDHALPGHDVGARKMFRWGDLVSFVESHPELPTAAKLAAKLRARVHSSAGAAAPADPETLKAIARDAKAAASAASDAALRAAQNARDAADGHLQMVQDLRTAIAALDSALTLALAPDTLND
ncbi:hypothetical protein [Mycolicibacterium mucogenicum]|uniref:DNA-binding protein n=1 Tax=Mycolicibacterium mucogenicum TaxID=56689 RepID=A0A4R5W771_MYCMU|nr:hypothetical protein [Mycolicibacterium mucogenicum]TDK84585.1 hypothetical protein EUA03_25870 [Mycolicibacterium mucogenicum]